MKKYQETFVDRAQTSVDDSKAGVGAVLTQNGTAVAYASKALTKAQVN